MPEPQRNTLFTTYPGKFVYTLLTLFINAARLPLWMLYFVPSALRPHPGWTWRQALRVQIVKSFLYWASVVEMVTPFDLEPGKEKDQWLNLSPVDARYYTGVANGDPTIKPAKFGATCYPSVPVKSASKVVLHFHGGAFVIGDGRFHECGFLAKTILRETKVNYVFAPNYRLASNPGGRFPAALQDAIASYVYLTNALSIKPEDIIVSGDSAGGNLVLCLLKYIVDHGKTVGIKSPGAAWLWSPWVDPVGGTDPIRFKLSPNEPTDYISVGFGAWGARCYMPLKSADITNAYIDFLNFPFKTETPLYFSIGENEMLMHDDFESAEKFEKLGNNVTKSLEEHCVHDVILIGDKTSFEKEATAAAKKAGTWLRKVRNE